MSIEPLPADEAIRTLRLKIDTRKQRHWTPGMSFSAEIGEVETLIAEIERLSRRLAEADALIERMAGEGYLRAQFYVQKYETNPGTCSVCGEPEEDHLEIFACPGKTVPGP